MVTVQVDVRVSHCSKRTTKYNSNFIDAQRLVDLLGGPRLFVNDVSSSTQFFNSQMLRDLSSSSMRGVSEWHAASVFDAVLRNAQPDPIGEHSTCRRGVCDRPENDRDIFQTSAVDLEKGRMNWSMFLEAMVSQVTRDLARQQRMHC